MDFEDLVRTITREVVKQLGQGTDRRKCIVILAPREQTPFGLSDRIGEDCEILHFGEDPCGKTVSRYILPELNCSDMAGLATGRAEGTYMTEVLNLLLKGVEVEVLEYGYKAFSETASGPLYSLYEAYMEQLTTFGLVPFRVKLPDTIRFRENLVTEKSVQAAHEKEASLLMVPELAKITPLALETASRLGMRIEKCL